MRSCDIKCFYGRSDLDAIPERMLKIARSPGHHLEEVSFLFFYICVNKQWKINSQRRQIFAIALFNAQFTLPFTQPITTLGFNVWNTKHPTPSVLDGDPRAAAECGWLHSPFKDWISNGLSNMIFALPQLERVTKSNLYSVGFKSGFKYRRYEL